MRLSMTDVRSISTCLGAVRAMGQDLTFSSKRAISTWLLIRRRISSFGCCKPQSTAKRFRAQLLLARNAVVVPVHFHARAILQKLLGFAA